eukprot:CAMPEP_0174696910 /NCGR_PEP_ID=MMETSP1094-20130205/2925_1 /TAXON_ID=156173 /ORGANISM="Chrysochromulina brevifilum, Strain UTEX LB 985" /LENGTH=123 /DNA_ID=CAMNT_0015893781 /DNA_START=201 /DNA_END=573 /DNA_ORIENTATION=+
MCAFALLPSCLQWVHGPTILAVRTRRLHLAHSLREGLKLLVHHLGVRLEDVRKALQLAPADRPMVARSTDATLASGTLSTVLPAFIESLAFFVSLTSSTNFSEESECCWLLSVPVPLLLGSTS